MIEGLIGDSVTRVDKGSVLVAQTGDTMQQIQRVVGEVSALMQQIAGASAEQSKGIAQVGDAVASMDSVTQQNASLVEEVSAAAASLARQTDELTRAVARFRLSAVAVPVAVSPTPAAVPPVVAQKSTEAAWLSF